MKFRVLRGEKSKVIQVMGVYSNNIYKFLPLFIFRHNFNKDNYQINIDVLQINFLYC